MHAPRQRTRRAHAKLNLFLRILAREAGGYHGIETLFQRVALHDLVHVEATDATRALDCDGPAMPPGGLGAPEHNLAWRAAAAFADATGWDTGWRIAIEKHIPVGGGLGGGSADAAAVLRALNDLAPTPLAEAALLELGGTLGADVPFLLADASRALAWARGDRLLVLPALAASPVVLVAFPAGVNTGDAYGAFAREREARGDVPRAVRLESASLDAWDTLAALAARTGNDFERVVPSLHAGVARTLPELRAAATQLRENGVAAIGGMSGSGATCFLLAAGAPAEALHRACADALARAALTADATLVRTTTY